MPEPDEIDEALGTEAAVVTPGWGIYPGVPFEEYKAWDAVNASLLCKLDEATPGHARSYQLGLGDTDTKPKKMGRLTHTALLEPKVFDETVITLPADAPNRVPDNHRHAKKPSQATLDKIAFWDEWDADPREKINPKDMELLQGMKRSVQRSQCRDYLLGGQSEVCIVWIDKPTGLLCKGRLDYLQQDGWGNAIISDIKTIAWFILEWRIKKVIFDLRYDIKAAFYVDGLKTILGATPHFVWHFVEKNPPAYYSKPYEMDEYTRHGGRTEYRRLLDQWAACVKRNDYPGPSAVAEVIQLDEWQLARRGVSLHENLPPE